MLFYPCIENAITGRINRRVSEKPMSKDDAEALLKRRYPTKWIRCEAIPQPVTMFERKE